MHQHNKVAMIVLDYHLLQRMGMNMEDADGLSGIPRSIEDVEVGVVLTEKEPGQVKVSFRSNQYVDVSKIAVSFGGGGHQRASGCTLNMDMDEAVKKVLAAVKDEVTQGAVKS
jgi:phosphoesterase RecJ-like protein